METSQIGLGFERKIGYSLVGLLAGDVAMLIVFSLVTQAWEQDSSHIIGTFPLYVTCSFFGWVAIGIPAALLFNTDYVAKLHWFRLALIAALLGSLALLIDLMILGQSLFSRDHLGEIAYYWGLAVLVAVITGTVYSALVRREVRAQEKSNSGALDIPLHAQQAPTGDWSKTKEPFDPSRYPADWFKSPEPSDSTPRPANGFSTSEPSDPHRSTNR